jgi:uncharacterized protein YjbI with pentapeptide repeats
MARPPAHDDHKERLESRKAELELALLEQQLTPSHQRREWLKVWGGLSGLAVATVSLIVALASIGQWAAQKQLDRELVTEKRIDDALAKLSSERPAERVSSVPLLLGFLPQLDEGRTSRADSRSKVRQAEDEERITGALISAFAREPDPQIGELLSLTLQSVDYTRLERPALNRLLAMVLMYNRAGLRAWRGPTSANSSPVGDPPRTLVVLSQAAGLMMRAGGRVKKFDEVYLVGGDFRRLSLPRTTFQDSWLDDANFSSADLRGTKFVNARLDGTVFVSADLQEATFRGEPVGYERPPSSFRELLKSSLHVTFYSYIGLDPSDPTKPYDFPDFSCADLRRVRFEQFPLFALWWSDEDDETVGSSVKLENANIAGAEFRSALMLAKEASRDGLSDYENVAAGGVVAERPRPPAGEPTATVMRFDAPLELQPGHADGFHLNLDKWFGHSNWTQAMMPVWLQRSLQAQHTSSVPLTARYARRDCLPRASWDVARVGSLGRGARVSPPSG